MAHHRLAHHLPLERPQTLQCVRYQPLMPMAQVPQRLSELDSTQPIVCYCHHGMRSQQVVAFLQRQGFESVYNLTGGIDAWSLMLEAENNASPVPRY